MKLSTTLLSFSALLISHVLPLEAVAQSRASDAADIDSLKKQLEETQKLLRQLQTTVESQAKELEKLQGASAGGGVVMPEVVESKGRTRKPTIGYSTPAIGLVAEAIASYDSERSEDSGEERTGGADFNVRTVELSAQASIDPFSSGYAFIAAHDHGDGESVLEVEEAAYVAHSLPLNSSLRLGRFFGEFGRLANRHDHELPFVNRPLVIEEFVGGESKVDGGEVNFLFPTEQYLTLTLGAGTQFGEDRGEVGSYRNMSELNYYGRLGTYAELGSDVSLELGLSGLWNDRAEGRGELPETQRRLGAVDVTFRYEPLDALNYQGLEWGTEVMFSRGKFAFASDEKFMGVGRDEEDHDHDHDEGEEVELGDSSESEDSMGLYSYVAAKLNREWAAGFLFDYAEAITDSDEQTLRYSPYLTWSPSEFQRWRLQYSFTDRDVQSELKDNHSVLLQWVYTIGYHSHGFRQR